MECSLGRITGRLADPGEKLSPDLIDLLNTNISPPEEIKLEDIHIRAMYIVSDEVNSYGGRFPTDEHRRLAELLVDSPVMVGHRKDKLPVGRTFHAALVERNGRNWIKSYFYWLKSADGAGNLKDNIDGGIYKECSIGFTFGLPECSICGEDIRLCSHEPFEKYDVEGEEVTCHFNYRQIETVLETSLVYRGAIPDTAVSRDLKRRNLEAGTDPLPALGPLQELERLDVLQEDGQYLVIPRYESIPVLAERQGDRLLIRVADGGLLDQSLAEQVVTDMLTEDRPHPGRLVGYRGKERCSVERLESYLVDRSGPVTRLVLMLIPNGDLPDLPINPRSRFEMRCIPHRRVYGRDLSQSVGQIKTKFGVEIWPLSGNEIQTPGYSHNPSDNKVTDAPIYTLTTGANSSSATLALDDQEEQRRIEIIGFDRDRLAEGRKFVGRMLTGEGSDATGTDTETMTGEIVRMDLDGDSVVLELNGEVDGCYTVRPIRLDGERRWLFFRRGDVST